MSQPIRFDDGAAYERGMAPWSRLAGDRFLDWLAWPPGQSWLDVGCGNGAFTELLAGRCAPREVQGVDASEGQLAFARTRPGLERVTFVQGDAMALPFEADRFDAATMALVIFFVPDPAKGVAEMVRVVRPGGVVAAYAWDILGGGFPFAPLMAEVRAAGLAPALPPSVDASREEAMRLLWAEAGLGNVETRRIEVQRSFASFDAYWEGCTSISQFQGFEERLGPAGVEELKRRVRSQARPGSGEEVWFSAVANAVRGVVRG